MTYLQAVIIAIVEGITEFLPISSTGHMIIAQKLLGVESSDFVKLFTVNIQLGAILSVIVLYWKQFVAPVVQTEATPKGSFLESFEKRYRFYLKLLVAFIPSAVIGLLLKDYIDLMLENVMVVAISLVTGGIFLLFVDKWFNRTVQEEDLNYKKSLTIGFFQVLAMIPGISRSAATIIGGLTQKLNRKKAAEFSFFLAVPTMFGASMLELYETFTQTGNAGNILLTGNNLILLLVGNAVAFVVAMIAIKSFINFLTRHGFMVFGYYRIVIGATLIILLLMGVDLNIIQ
jgi:undecaprenyl-diphosphatase